MEPSENSYLPENILVPEGEGHSDSQFLAGSLSFGYVHVLLSW